MSSSILLGHQYISQFDINEISIDIRELLYNVEIYGMIGRGKTRLVSSIIQHLFHNRVPSLIFDIKGEYAATFATEPNVEVFTIGPPHPLCVNLFDTEDENDVRGTLLIIDEMMASSNQEFSPSMKNLFETALFLTHQTENRTLETFVEQLITLARGNNRVSTIHNTLDAVLNRLNFIFNPSNFEILGVNKTTLSFDAMDQGKSIILDLSQFQRRAARPVDIYLVCNLILKLFYRFAPSKELTNKLRYVVVLEEAINIIPNIYRTQSSASMITAENNILLGRSLGIGHILCSQMWDSVSRIVHANASTKIVFRSSHGNEKVAKALTLQDDQFEILRQLPIQHCFIWKNGQERTIEMKTVDFNLSPLNYHTYLLFLKRKYPSVSYPLLFDSFIDMRTSLYNKFNTHKQLKRKKQFEGRNKQQKNKQSKEKKKLELKEVFEPDDICKIFCTASKTKKSCQKIRNDALSAIAAILKKFSESELEQVILGEMGTSIEVLIKQTLKEMKLLDNNLVLTCAQKELTNQLLEKK